MFVYASSWSMMDRTGSVTQFEFNPLNETLRKVRTFLEGVPVGTVFTNKEKNVLYAVREDSVPEEGKIYSLDIKDGTRAELLSEVPTLSSCTAFLGFRNEEGIAIAANHARAGSEPSVNLYEMGPDGSLGKMLDRIVHEGCGFLEKQDMPHPHSAVFSPDGKLCAVCDKGNDSVYMYSVQGEGSNRKLSLSSKWKVGDGYAPRYSAFHPSGNLFFHNNEEKNLICAYKRDGDDFTLTGEYETIPGYSVPGEHVAQQGLAISPDGRYFYSISLGNNSIGVFGIDREDGSLKHIQTFNGSYEWPRTLEFSTDGRYIFAAYKASGKLVVYRISDGLITGCVSEADLENAAGIAVID